MRPVTRTLSMMVLLFAFQGAQATSAPSDSQLNAIARMGELNGIALQCRFLDQMRRIKQVLIKNLPKQRALGAWFEEKTHESFMDFMKKDSACPGLIEFDRDLDTAAKQVEEAFSS